MLTRRAFSAVSAKSTGLSGIAASSISARRQLNSQVADERWYGHHFYFDNHVYKFTGEKPLWMRNPAAGGEESKRREETIPHIDFATSYEAIQWDACRLNPHLERKEFANEVRFRLEKQSSTVYRSQQLLKESYDEKTEDSMIAKIFDEEHVQAEMKYIKCIRANEFAEDSRLDILPGGSPNSLREKARWNLAVDLHPVDRCEVMKRLMAWLPEKYHIVYQDDFQNVAANDASHRQTVGDIIDKVEGEFATEAKQAGYEEDLKETIKELRDDADPTREITSKAIASCSSLEQLEAWSRLVHEYNGDGRLLEIYERAASITNNAGHKKILADLRAWKSMTPDVATASK